MSLSLLAALWIAGGYAPPAETDYPAFFEDVSAPFQSGATVSYRKVLAWQWISLRLVTIAKISL